MSDQPSNIVPLYRCPECGGGPVRIWFDQNSGRDMFGLVAITHDTRPITNAASRP